jgi:D-alanyl-D-alanine carboxypeptidase
MQRHESRETILLNTFKKYEKNKLIKHMLISAQSLEGDFKFDYNYGIKDEDGTPVNQQTPFMIASVTKLFIATTILKLHELKQLNINDLITKYLEDDLIEGIHVYQGKSNHKAISIKHLLSHTSGILDYIEIKDINKKTIFDRVINDGDTVFNIPEMLSIVKKAQGAYFNVQSFEDKKIKARYSDTNFQLLRAIIEKVTGTDCDNALHQYIFSPLGMKDTFLPSDELKNPYIDVAKLWVMEDALNRPLALRSFGDYYSTKNDLFVFMRGLIKLKVFKNQSTLDLMMNDFNTFGLSFSPVAPAWPIAYSMGMMKFTMPLLFSKFKRMPTVYGHTGVGSAFLFYSPKLDLMLCGTVGQVRYTALPFQVLPKLLIQLDKLSV